MSKKIRNEQETEQIAIEDENCTICGLSYCWQCKEKIRILEYCDLKYNGLRGYCPKCGINFPLQ